MTGQRKLVVGQLVSLDEFFRPERTEQLEQAYSKKLCVHDVALYRAGEGEVLADGPVVELRPQHARGVEHLEALADCEPLVASGDTGAVGGYSLGFPGDAVDEGGLAHVGDTDDHHTHGGVCHALSLVALDARSEQLGEHGDKAVDSPAALAVDRDGADVLLRQIRDPSVGSARISHVALVEQDDARLAVGEAGYIRVARGYRDASVDYLGYGVYELDVLLHAASGLGHMTGVPLDDLAVLGGFARLRLLRFCSLFDGLWGFFRRLLRLGALLYTCARPASGLGGGSVALILFIVLHTHILTIIV